MLCIKTDEEMEEAASIYPGAWTYNFFAHDTQLKQLKHLFTKGAWVGGRHRQFARIALRLLLSALSIRNRQASRAATICSQAVLCLCF